ncbi:hypothetical protein IMX26_03855 [Clostridium sp. 'deep sea']|uniref:hypothetical protein n=1 Tax=Clostridium sp. 'deep sea' TaxID=2779445 RepID=UPI00189679CB|nr:hypothetical protein [Clostridium sp. 'deep sea']QOR35966.1 hypothetical protein IMX26_03855 [Clostridium sp. 'deep sea']
MNLQEKWNQVINKRERKKELEKLLTSLKEDITFAELNKVKEDEHAESRVDVLLKDLSEIESELNSLDNIEDEYQAVLKERIEFICANDNEAKQFIMGVEKAIAGLETELAELNKKASLLSNLKKKAEITLKQVKTEGLKLCYAKELINECNRVLKDAFNVKSASTKMPEVNELYLWKLYQTIDELDIDLKEKIQTLIPQIIELNMRREEHLDNYDG